MVVNYNFCFLCFVAPRLEMPKAATRDILYERVFLEICQNLSQGLFFNKVYEKLETLAQVFSCEFCEISKNTLFPEHLLATASKMP